MPLPWILSLGLGNKTKLLGATGAWPKQWKFMVPQCLLQALPHVLRFGASLAVVGVASEHHGHGCHAACAACCGACVVDVEHRLRDAAAHPEVCHVL